MVSFKKMQIPKNLRSMVNKENMNLSLIHAK